MHQTASEHSASKATTCEQKARNRALLLVTNIRLAAIDSSGESYLHFGRILFAICYFRTLHDVASPAKTRIIRRKLSPTVAMQNARRVFESLQGHTRAA